MDPVLLDLGVTDETLTYSPPNLKTGVQEHNVLHETRCLYRPLTRDPSSILEPARHFCNNFQEACNSDVAQMIGFGL